MTPANLDLLLDYLHEHDLATHVVADGEHALQQIDDIEPVLIVLDATQSGIDGFETCRRIKADAQDQDVPVLLLIAEGDTQSRIRAFQAGADDYLAVPLQQEEVAARLALHLTIYGQRGALEESRATKDKFFSVIGHDLRGPFTVLLGFSEIFADPERDLTRAQRNRFGALLNQSAHNAHNLLENLLTWATLERGQMAYNPRPIDLHLSVGATFELFEYSAGVKEIELRHTLTPDTTIYADPDMLSTMLRNLISNGIKFTGSGGLVEVTATPSDGDQARPMVEVQIRDTGIGMPEEIRRQIFHESFSSVTAPARGEGWTGLGLLLCREFALRNGGRLWVDSVEGKGSTVYLALPKSGPTHSDHHRLQDRLR